MRIIMLSYGSFNCNSGGHMANFANRLAQAGHCVAMVAEGRPQDVHDFVDPLFECFPHEVVESDPEAILYCGDPSIGLDDTILHVWTPRDGVVAMTRSLMSFGVKDYFVHLEDNEEVLAAANLHVAVERFAGVPDDLLPDPYPMSLSHPRRYREFLAGATGVTVIVPTLAAFVPQGRPVHVLEPGVDVAIFADRLPPERERGLREELGLDPDEAVCVYNGNMHAANRREIFSLYTAFLILTRRGRKVRLIRTGRDFDDGLDLSYAHLKEGVIDLGFVDRGRLTEVLKLADFFVQPGTSNPFNDYRFPSKIPEFLAVGRPVVLPATNIALHMRDRVDASFLVRGDGEEIADRVEEILDDPALAGELGRNARSFATRELNWETNTEKLLQFYSECLDRRVDVPSDRPKPQKPS